MNLRGISVLLIGMIAGFVVFSLPIKNLGFAGHAALGLLVFAIFIWSSEALPLALSSIIILLVQPVIGIATFEDAVRGLANPIVLLLLGGFMIAEGVTSSGLVERLTYATLSKIDRPRMVVLAAIVFTGTCRHWSTT